MPLYTVHFKKAYNVFSFTQFTDELEARAFSVWLAIEKGYTCIQMIEEKAVV